MSTANWPPRGARHLMRHLEWRLSQATYDKFRELLDELQVTSMHNPKHFQLLDDMRSLPGYPRNADPELDLIHFHVTTERAN